LIRSIRATVITLLLVSALLTAVLLVPGCSPEMDSPQMGEVAQSDSEAGPPTALPATEEDELYTPTYKPAGNEVAVITTSKGVIRFEFFTEDAPNHVAAFIELAEKGFYDGVKFHRVEPGFVIQGGDPYSKTDDPMVGRGGPGYTLAAEFNERLHLDGTVSMARGQSPDSAGSQFFICLGPQPFLDGQYTVFGQVIEGLDVVHAIAVGDVMQSVRIERAE